MNTTKFANAAVAAFMAMSAPAAAIESVIALSPNISKADREAQGRLSLEHILASLKAGETTRVINGVTHKLIGVYTAPAKEGLRAGARTNPKFMRGLKAFMEMEDGDTSAAIDLPGLLRHVGDRYPASKDRLLIVVGSPIHHTEKDVGFSMRDNAAVPSDSHLSASRDASPYGAVEDKGRLSNYRAYFGAVGPDWKVSEQHAFRVERFIGLSFIARNAEFMTFSEDAETAFRDARSDGLPGRAYELKGDERMTMLHFQPEPPESEDTGRDARSTPIFGRSLETEPADVAEIAAASNVEVAIRWDCRDCDLDLAVRPENGAETIFFGKPSTSSGQLYKDFTNSPSVQNGWETVALTGGPRALRDVVVAVNLYNGVAQGGATGEVRIAIDGKTWSARFRISAAYSNQGSGRDATMASGRASNDAWVVIDPVAVVSGAGG